MKPCMFTLVLTWLLKLLFPVFRVSQKLSISCPKKKIFLNKRLYDKWCSVEDLFKFSINVKNILEYSHICIKITSYLSKLLPF